MDADPYTHPELVSRRPAVEPHPAVVQRERGRANSIILNAISRNSCDNVKRLEALLELDPAQGYYKNDVLKILDLWTFDQGADDGLDPRYAAMLNVIEFSQECGVDLPSEVVTIFGALENKQDVSVKKTQPDLPAAQTKSAAIPVSLQEPKVEPKHEPKVAPEPEPKPKPAVESGRVLERKPVEKQEPELEGPPPFAAVVLDEKFIGIRTQLITALENSQKKWGGHKKRLPSLLDELRGINTAEELLKCIQTQIKIHRQEPTGIDPNLGRHLVPMKRPNVHGKFWRILHEYQAILENQKPEERARPKKRFFFC